MSRWLRGKKREGNAGILGAVGVILLVNWRFTSAWALFWHVVVFWPGQVVKAVSGRTDYLVTGELLEDGRPVNNEREKHTMNRARMSPRACDGSLLGYLLCGCCFFRAKNK